MDDPEILPDPFRVSDLLVVSMAFMSSLTYLLNFIALLP